MIDLFIFVGIVSKKQRTYLFEFLIHERHLSEGNLIKQYILFFDNIFLHKYKNVKL
jgi:hypothetical protein